MVKNLPAMRETPGFNPWVGKIPWRRAWQPTAVFLPEESHGQRSMAGYSPWGHKELDTTEWLNNNRIFALSLLHAWLGTSHHILVDSQVWNCHVPANPTNFSSSSLPGGLPIHLLQHLSTFSPFRKIINFLRAEITLVCSSP